MPYLTQKLQSNGEQMNIGVDIGLDCTDEQLNNALNRIRKYIGSPLVVEAPVFPPRNENFKFYTEDNIFMYALKIPGFDMIIRCDSLKGLK